MHGPAELAPVSSSGHTTLVPFLLGWPHPGLEPELRKAFEVALHAGTAAGLLVGMRAELGSALPALDAGDLVRIAVATLPAAALGLALERPIERRLGTPATIAAGLVAGSLAMVVADGRALARGRRGRRSRREAGLRDALWLGAGQALALVPGMSRNGCTLAAARWRGFAREDADVISRHLALPIICGATALKGWRLARRGLPGGLRAPFAAGTAAAFASTLAATRVLGLLGRARSPVPFALYRLGLAAATLARRRAVGENRAL